MSDYTNPEAQPNNANTEQNPGGTGWSSVHGGATPQASFCQDCGRPLTAADVRNINGGCFCPNCAVLRTGYPWAGQTPGQPGAPQPVLAAILGFIPGVGAMYNGQFAKGLAHVAVFATLVWCADHINGIFGLGITGWVFYQVFDAYHTAKARRDGTPLPDPLGFNDIDLKVGIHRRTPGTPAAPPPAAEPAAQAPVTGWAASYNPPPAVPTDAPAGYAQTYTSVPMAPMPVVPPSRFPVGAVVLIGLGILFLLGRFIPYWHLSPSWIIAFLFFVVGIASLLRSLRMQRALDGSDGSNASPLRTLACIRGPLFVLALAVVFLVQALDWFTLGQSWPVLLILGGVLLLAERAAEFTTARPDGGQ